MVQNYLVSSILINLYLTYSNFWHYVMRSQYSKQSNSSQSIHILKWSWNSFNVQSGFEFIPRHILQIVTYCIQSLKIFGAKFSSAVQERNLFTL
jgi:hypothetical protein